MKPTTIKLSDIKLMLNLFAPKMYELFIYDPNSKLEIDENNEDQLNNKSKNNLPKILINLEANIDCLKQYASNDFEFIVDFSNKISLSGGYKSKGFDYINNANKTIRWIYPQKIKKPTFLNLFNSSTIKAKAYCTAIKLLFQTGLSSLCRSSKFTIHYKNNLKIDELLKTISFENYSIFTGTVGINRKLLVEVNTKNETTHYVKVGINNHSITLIQNEIKMLRNLGHQKLHSVIIPELVEGEDAAICISTSIKSGRTTQGNTLKTAHFKALEELYKKNLFVEQFINSSLYGKIVNNIHLLKNAKRFKESQTITDNLRNVFDSITKDQIIYFANGHVDFTPWNMYVSNDKLHLYDWELAQSRVPVLFDIFHFVFQANILIKKTNLKTIRKEIDIALNSPIINKFITTYNIDVELHYKLYLLLNVSYYMNVYETQKNLHEQSFWLTKIWSEALSQISIITATIPLRQIFLSQFSAKLSATKYAMLKFTEGKFENLKDSSDLDILILKEDLESMISYFKNSAIVSKVKIHQKSFMTTAELFFKDGSYLSIDLICNFKRKWSTILNPEKILRSAVRNEYGILVAEPRFDFEYTMLFYTLNGASIPTKYEQHYLSLNTNELSRIQSYICSAYQFKKNEFVSLFEFSKANQEHLKRIIANLPLNKGVQKLASMLRYLVDTTKNSINRKGIIISFSGVDGAGKTTTIENVKERLANQFRKKVVVLRHRPSVFPILSAFKYGKNEAQRLAAVKLPHSGKNNNPILSFARFSYYFLDYLIGQPYVYIKYILKGYVVLYDRYYFDFINDSKRSNLVLSRNFTKSLYKFIVKPELNIFLYASPDVILKRKQELKKESIVELTSNYKKLFSEFNIKYKNSNYIQVENIDLDDTTKQILRAYSTAA
jgi:thymidylate kinase